MESEPIINQNKDNNKNNQNNNREYWKEEEENILRELADKAQCYELMHSKSRDIYNYKNTLFVIPVIIISTLTGTANFAQDRVPEKYQNTFVMVVGSFNILAAIITTIAQYLKIAELNESYRVGTLQWGKFYRNIKMELIKHPLDRMSPSAMLSMCKEEFDRLLEIYPNIPKKVIEEFKVKFNKNTKISKPEICDVIEPTTIFQMTKEERIEMIKKITNTFDVDLEKNKDKEEKDIVPVIEETELDHENNMKTEKFRQTFYKINNRYPTEKEVKETFSNLFLKRPSELKFKFGLSSSSPDLSPNNSINNHSENIDV
jgi:hypothetical protein